MPHFLKLSALAACLSMAVILGGCTDLKSPATANVAVADAALTDALSAGGGEYAPVEIRSAREKLSQAQSALKDRDYRKADTLAKQALVDAKLAQSKANSAKAQATAKELQNDIQVLQKQIEGSATNQ